MTGKEFAGTSPTVRAAFFELMAGAILARQSLKDDLRMWADVMAARAGQLLYHPDKIKVENDPAALELLIDLAETAYRNMATPAASITCPLCGRTSYNPHDVSVGYCGSCHAFLGNDSQRL